MAQTEGYVSLSRSKLGPEADPTPLPVHGVRYVERDGGCYRATCRCGWNKRRKALDLARESLAAHIELSSIIDVGEPVG